MITAATNYSTNSEIPISKQSRHLEVANSMADEITTFEPYQQNEMVKQIFALVRERRGNQIQEFKEKADFLLKSLEEIK